MTVLYSPTLYRPYLGTLGEPAPFHPNDLSDMNFWIRAGDQIPVSDDTNVGSPLVDSGPNARPFSRINGVKWHSTDGPNSQPSLKIHTIPPAGVNNLCIRAYNANLNPVWCTRFILARSIGSGDSGVIRGVWGHKDVAGTRGDALFMRTDSDGFQWNGNHTGGGANFGFLNVGTTPSKPFSDNVWYLFGMRLASDGSGGLDGTFCVNSLVSDAGHVNIASQTPDVNTVRPDHHGGDGNGNGENNREQFAESLLYDRALTDVEMDQVMQFFADRYALTLTS